MTTLTTMDTLDDSAATDRGVGHGLRIVFLTPEEPSVLPVYFWRVLSALAAETAGIAVVSPIYAKSSWVNQAKRFIKAFGIRDFSIEAMQYAVYKVTDVVHRITAIGKPRSVKGIARYHGVPLLTPTDVNAEDFLGELRSLRPDLIISVSCPQIFKSELLGLPPLGCVNLHSARLPDYRGVLPTFWALANGETDTGVTAHYMNTGIDGGEIIAQASVEITGQDTLHSLMRKCKLAAAELTLETVQRARAGGVQTIPNPADGGAYFSFPRHEDVLRFRSLGRTMR